MHCAYLRIDDKWVRTNQHDAVLDHDGDCVICETPEDEAEVGLVFAERDPDKFVSRRLRDDWIVTDHPFSSNPFDLSFMSEHKTVVVDTGWNGRIPNFTRHSHKGREYYVAGMNATPEQMVPGVIAEMYGDSMNLWKLTIDMDAWKVANDIVQLRDRRNKRRAAAKVTYHDIRSLGMVLVRDVAKTECLPWIKTDPADARIAILGITLADCVLGVDKTNSLIKDIAAKWIKNKAENTARFTEKKWLSAEHLDKLNRRFEQAVADLLKRA